LNNSLSTNTNLLLPIHEVNNPIVEKLKLLFACLDNSLPNIIELIKLIQTTDPRNTGKGEFFTVTFTKRTDGTIRTMNARLGVRKYLKGGELPYDAAEKELLPVFDVPKNAYRMIDLRSIISAKLGGQEYIVQ
jgi:hypothetical protein